ncbi:hypothetical protein AB0D49_16760 [Streptomyces sp. NPDC048290]|uniref:hypothetical protein n=1 Tax=Streptomyces sp. NPDC048290 TaxID=3155811 RepID=UPI00341249F1
MTHEKRVLERAGSRGVDGSIGALAASSGPGADDGPGASDAEGGLAGAISRARRLVETRGAEGTGDPS